MACICVGGKYISFYEYSQFVLIVGFLNILILFFILLRQLSPQAIIILPWLCKTNYIDMNIRALLLLTFLVFSLPMFSQNKEAVEWDSVDFSGIEFRSIGPAFMSGRISLHHIRTFLIKRFKLIDSTRFQ